MNKCNRARHVKEWEEEIKIIGMDFMTGEG